MRVLLVIYAVASLFLAYMGWATNRGAQMNRSYIVGTLRRLHPVGVDPVDESTRQFYQRDLPEIERVLRQTESDTKDFMTFGLASFVFSVLVFIGYSASQISRVQQSAGGNAAPPRASA
jgi:hypothetical protein